VPSTLNEHLLLEHLLAGTTDRNERIVLLQHAIDNITSTFYTQVMFANFELEAHRAVQRDEPVTAESLSALYGSIFAAYYGDSVDQEELTPITWARIPHFFNTPFYVYQYATCFASAARLAAELTEGSAESREEARLRYLRLLSSGGNDHPMTLLKNAGVDLSQPETVQATVDQLDRLVTRLEAEVGA
jgi:oligoendopeptidase F